MYNFYSTLPFFFTNFKHEIEKYFFLVHSTPLFMYFVLHFTPFYICFIINKPLTQTLHNSFTFSLFSSLHHNFKFPTVSITTNLTMNFAFTEGKYNGSTLTILGRNAVFHKVREMPVIGGSGVFRFARGYAEANTHWIEIKSGDVVVEYNVYVFHY